MFSNLVNVGVLLYCWLVFEMVIADTGGGVWFERYVVQFGVQEKCR